MLTIFIDNHVKIANMPQLNIIMQKYSSIDLKQFSLYKGCWKTVGKQEVTAQLM